MNNQENPSVTTQSSNSTNIVNNASTPISSDSPSNSYTVNQGNVSNIQSETLAALTNLCSPQSGLHSLGDEFALSQEFKTRLWSLFRQIETEFEKECKKMYSENYALHDRNEKIESSDHEETNFAKKISGSHFSQKIKQQYKQSKQSTSRLVSTFRDRGSAVPNVSANTNHQSNRQTCTLCWRVSDHRDGIWDVNCIGRGLVGTASADGSIRLWSTESGHCTLCYIGHSGSVNSVRFKNGIMLTASGDGTAHWVILPPDKVSDAMNTIELGKFSVTDNVTTPSCNKDDENVEDSVSAFINTKRNVVCPSGEDCRDVNSIENPLMILRNPNSMYQTASMFPSLGSYTYHDSAPLSAADFLSNRDQIVTAGWDRLGRIYDVATGSEVSSLTGHDLPLTDVRTSPVMDHTLAVTASKDCTFRLWDFRCSSTEVHVQQGHNGVVSSVSFVGNSGEKLVSAGADRVCKLWDLRQNRNPLHVIRTDSPINRLAVHPSGKMVALPMDNRSVKIFDLNLATRIARLPRSSNQSHSRIVTNVTWTADGGGKPNFFSCGFDQQLLAWNLQTPILTGNYP